MSRAKHYCSLGALALGIGVVGWLPSCVQLNPDHCVVSGGDLACDDGSICVASITAGQVAPGEQSNGCVAQAPDPALFVAVPYGLPARLGSEGDTGTDSVAGVLAQVAPDCATQEADLQSLAAAWQPIVGVRDHLQARPKSKASAFDLSPSHVAAITDFSAAVESWVAACDTEPPATTTDTDTDTSSDSTTGEESTSSTGGDCVVDDDCQGAAEGPFCDPASGQCVECGGDDPDGVCAAADPSVPLCVDGACGECREGQTTACDEQALVCDVGTGTCVGCTAHEQCASGACERATGQCFDDSIAIIHVDGDSGSGRDFSRVVEAIASVPDGGLAVIVVHERDAETVYEENVVIDAGKTLVLRGADGERPLMRAPGPALTVSGAMTTAYIDRLVVLESPNSVGMVVDGATAWVDRSEITANAMGDIQVQAGAELQLHNSFVGGDLDGVMALSVEGSTIGVVHSTVAAGGTTAMAITCDGSTTALVRNSIVLARANEDEVQCADAVFEYTASERDRGGTNVDLGSVSAIWFADYSGGDFHLTADAPEALTTAARWSLGDTFTDIDGDARVGVDGSMEYAGADIPAR